MIRFDDKTGDTGGGHTEEIVNWLVDQIEPGDIFIDCGAHVGFVGIPVAKRTGVKSFFIEPDTHTATILNDNLNNEAVKGIIINKLVLDEVGKRDYFYHSKSSGNTVVIRGEEFVTKESITIDSLVKDYNIKDRIVMKIDVELAEPLVWKGIRESLNQVKAIVMEWRPNLLENSGQFFKDITKKSGFKVAKIIGGSEMFGAGVSKVDICLKR